VFGVGGLIENVLDDVTGWIVPKRDSERLAERIMKVLSLDEPKKKQITRLAIERVREKFNIGDHIVAWTKFYE
jgi:colanic acid/amylovoran biosynthesis glycosyltransferase